jgi:hypothetical protein
MCDFAERFTVNGAGVLEVPPVDRRDELPADEIIISGLEGDEAAFGIWVGIDYAVSPPELRSV